MINLDDEKMSFTFKGEVYKVAHPSVELYEKLIEDLKSGKKTEVKCFYDFMTELGLELSFVKKMSIVQLRALTRAFIEGK